MTSNSYYEWFIYHDYILYGAFAIANQWAATFKEFPPVQKPNSFTIDDALKMISAATGADSNGGTLRQAGGSSPAEVREPNARFVPYSKSAGTAVEIIC